ncbi:Ppx/GppA family phosphatase [candidate division KSB1 bacterium]|nr:Ppx/GppA family phosphatase [candidate division KSB1 bacterium]
MEKHASIDIGTNSTRLLIVERRGKGKLSPLLHEERITRLGEGLGKSGELAPASMERVIDAVLEYNEIISANHIRQVRIVATSAVRDARNRSLFLDALSERTGRTCHVISGAEEARLTYLGVFSDFPADTNAIVIDVGGGSTEYIVATGGVMHTKISIDIGSRRLSERFFASDPVTDTEFDAFQKYVRAQLAPKLENFPRETFLGIAVGGTASTLAQVQSSLAESLFEQIHLMEITRNKLIQMVADFRSRTIEQRRKIVGLNPKRADVILAGAAILAESLEMLNLSAITVSLRDLLFGVLLTDDL